MTPKALFTFPSVYTLFPLGHSEVYDSKGHNMNIDFFNADDWLKTYLGIFADQTTHTEKNSKFLIKALERAKIFRKLIVNSGKKYPPIFVICSRAHPTLFRVVVNGPKSIRGVDF